MAKKNNVSRVILSDLVDKKTVDKFLKTFYKTFGIGCNCVDESKVIANISMSKFCRMTRNTEKGCKLCEACDRDAWKKIKKTGKPALYQCHAGLVDIAIPIIVDNKYLGMIMGGQISTGKIDEQKILELSKQIEIENSQEYLDAAKKIKCIKSKEIKKAVKVLSLIAQTVSETAYSMYLLKKEAEKKEFILSLIAAVESASSKNKLYNIICKKIMNFFNADRILIVEFSKNGTYNILQELKADKSIKSVFEVLPKNTAEKIMTYWNDIVFNKNEEVTFNSVNAYDIPDFIREAYNKIGLVSAMTTIFNRTETSATVVVLGKYNNDNIWTEDDVKGFNLCGKQVNIAINKIKLTEKAKIRALREKALLDNLPASAFLKDVNGKFLAVNDAFLACGLSREQILGHDDFEFEPFDVAASYQAEDLEVINSKKPFRNIRKVIRNGKELWMESYKSPVFDENGNVVAITGFNKDITAQMTMDKLKNQFISIISHELRTPLTSISGSIDLMLNGLVGNVDAPCTEMLKIAQKNTNKLTSLINNILELEALETNTMTLKFSSQKVKTVLMEAIETSTKPKTAVGTHIKTDIDLENECINIDKEKFIKVLHNIISNAYKFSDIGEDIIVSTKVKKKDVYITITDTGVEIPEGMEAKVFNKFKEMDTNNQHRQEGIGLGLAIAKLLVEKMNGTISYSSKKNKTSFMLTFPIAK